MSVLPSISDIDTRSSFCAIALRKEQDPQARMQKLIEILKKGLFSLEESSDPSVDTLLENLQDIKELNFDNLCLLLKNTQTEPIRNLIVSAYLQQFATPEAQITEFARVLHEGVLINIFLSQDYEVFKCFKNVGFKKAQSAELCRALFPQNEIAQVDLFHAALLTGNVPYEGRAEYIRGFAESLQADDQCLAVLEMCRNEGYGLTAVDVLLVTNKRIASGFKSLQSVLDIPLEQALTVKGAVKFKKLFGDFPAATALGELKLGALFSYYSIYDNVGEFMSLIKPEVKGGFAKNFKPSEASPLILQKEQQQLLQLGIRDLPSCVQICDYLKKNREDVPKIETSKKALNKLILNELIQAKLGKGREPVNEIEYRELLEKGEGVTADDVLAFFTTITGQDINPREAHKLLDLFKGRKEDLTYLFSKENGINDYLLVLNSLGHGCVANIGTMTTLYLNEKLMKTTSARMLYPFFNNRIVIPVLSQRGSDMLGASSRGVDPITDSSIMQNYLSPPGVYESLCSVLKNSDSFRPQDIIQALADDDEQGEYGCADFLFDESVSAEQKTEINAKICAYLIIRDAMPEVFDHPSFESYKADVEDILQEQPAETIKNTLS